MAKWNKYTYTNIFKKINNLSCYWAGFIMADGGVYKNTLRIELDTKDRCHLEQFLKDIKSDAPIRTNRTCVYIAVNSKEIVESLRDNFNITTKKSLTAMPPKLSNEKHIIAFITGLIDGDGSIYERGDTGIYQLGFTGTRSMCEFLKDNIETWVPSKRGTNARKIPKKNAFIIVFGGRLRMPKIFNKLNEVQVPRLNRKWSLV